jgi:hypothetical protein
VSLTFQKEEYHEDLGMRVLFYQLSGTDLRELDRLGKMLGDWCRDNCEDRFSQEYGDSGVLWFASDDDALLCRIRFP